LQVLSHQLQPSNVDVPWISRYPNPTNLPELALSEALGALVDKLGLYLRAMDFGAGFDLEEDAPLHGPGSQCRSGRA